MNDEFDEYGEDEETEIIKIKKTKFFLRTIIISLSGIFAVLLAVFIFLATLGNWIKPPDIPSFDDTKGAFLIPEGNDADAFIGGGLSAPEGFTNEDRKELFYTFLIIGLDEGTNTDTIMIASYDGVDKQANIINIPRDSLVNVQRNLKKINAAYPVGTLNGRGRDGGIAQLQREIKTVIGFVPDFYICVNLEAFIKIVDTLDGVDVNVPFHMRYDDPFQGLHINIPAGEQNLNGEQALKFARYRFGNSSRDSITDYQRIENQQAVIKAVLEKLISPANILKIPAFIEIFTENIYSDLKTGNMLWFADELNKIRGTDALSTYTMPTTGTSGPPMYYEYLDEARIVELVNKTVNPFNKDIQAKDLDIIR